MAGELVAGPNVVKSIGASATEAGCIRRNGTASTIMLGNGSKDYGATTQFNYWGTATLGGGTTQTGPYAVYQANLASFTPGGAPSDPDQSNGALSPSGRTAPDNASFILMAQQYGGSSSITTVEAAIAYFHTQNDLAIANRDYEAITTNGLVTLIDPGFIWSCPRAVTSTWFDLAGGNTSYNLTTFTSSPSWAFSSANPAGKGQGTLLTNGTSSYATTGATNAPTVTTGVTVCCWINTNTTLTGSTGFVNAANTFATVASGYGLGRTTSYPIFKWNNGSARNITPISGTAMSQNAWHYVCAGYTNATADGYTPGNAKIWLYSTTTLLNSYSTTSAQNGTGNVSAPTIPLQLGFGNAGATYNGGNIGVVKVYNRLLTDAEVAQNFNAQKARYA